MVEFVKEEKMMKVLSMVPIIELFEIELLLGLVGR